MEKRFRRCLKSVTIYVEIRIVQMQMMEQVDKAHIDGICHNIKIHL